ncbi:MAG: hypothetical protein QXW47_00590 [Candidatus Jordarchaeales archaeon]
MPQSVNDNMIYQFHNMIPGLVFRDGNVFLDLSTIERMRSFQVFKGELELKSTYLLPSGVPVRREFIEGLYVLQQELEAAKPKIWGVKGEITGPLTEAYSVTILPKHDKAIHEDYIFDVVLKTTCEVASWISSKITEITKKMAGKNGLPILFIDEPLLPLVLREHDAETVREALEQVLRRVKCRKGVHVCDEPVSVIDMILELEVDYFSFDLIKYPKTLEMADKERLKIHVDEGRGVAFGATPNTPESIMDDETLYRAHKGEVNVETFLPTPQKIANTVVNSLESVRGKVNVEELAINSLITPQCGFRSFNVPNPEEGEKTVRKLLERQEKAAQIIRKKYGVSRTDEQ